MCRGVVGQHLPLADAMLALHEAVVRGEDHVRVVELARAAKLLDDLLDALVDGQERLPALAEPGRDGAPHGAG